MTNVRVRSSRARNATDLINAKAAALPKAKKLKTIDSESEEVNRRIERLQVFVAKAPGLAKKRNEELRDYVPPMDAPVRRKKGAIRVKRIPLQKAQMARRRAFRLGLEFLVLALIIAAILGWLNQHFQFFA
jgi:hypothetical protein